MEGYKKLTIVHCVPLEMREKMKKQFCIEHHDVRKTVAFRELEGGNTETGSVLGEGCSRGHYLQVVVSALRGYDVSIDLMYDLVKYKI